ncbi:UvrD-helicase domain-containing protein [Acetobacteraceae bacterium KSS8]|uniref:DNA 3'-5' helicase II n=1 Tax=Endosaccharibacter trunci TaxID=2812733 RepID=A0ABT1WA38_9PROT|nr:UvrD-helicase domain-containing protein [Acetobacteraceae bacterium KSS8]
MYKSLVMDRTAVATLESALIDIEWFDKYTIPDNSEDIRVVIRDSTVYILSNDADVNSRFLVVNLTENGVFRGSESKKRYFERILRVALHCFDRNVSLPIQWQAYHDGSRLSIYAESIRSDDQNRIYFDQNAGERGNLYAYAVTKGPQQLFLVNPDMVLYNEAVRWIDDAIYSEDVEQPPVGNLGILLSERIGTYIGGSTTLEQWLNNRLNTQQLKFVEKPHSAPVRLRGAAGTGKTQAMLVKCLKDMYDDESQLNTKTFAFLTHSSALAHEVVRGMLYSLDPSGRWQTLRTAGGETKIWIGTIYELAQQHLNYARKGVTPLAVDGREGREYQRILIDSSLKRILNNPHIVHGVLASEAEFLARLKNEESRPALIEEIMNEFACTLDAENIHKGSEAAEAYLRGRREKWQMDLPTADQRKTILEIHDVYRSLLKQERFLSMDQMIADYGRYLHSHEWEQLRDRDGFDVIFVDEYHYFNRVEAMTLHELFKSRAKESGGWPLFMAYDLKQSVNDAGLGGGFERFRNPGVGKSVEVELTENYRSTPQITRFLQDFDAAFPSADLEGEYNTFIAHSRGKDGEIPTLKIYDTNYELIDRVFEAAVDKARRIGGRRVAVLCLVDHLFDRYRDAGRISGKFVSIISRDDLKELQFARSRCVFSMPEYVAGLQFDTVYLIHADRTDLASDGFSPGARRRYINRIYLGASRAQETLYLVSSRERGGPSEVLSGPLENKTIVEV